MKIRVILVRPQGPINIGLVARACANLNVEALQLVAPACAPDALEARMFANHAQELLTRSPSVASLEAALQGCDWVVGTTARRRRDTLPHLPLEAVRPQAVSRQVKRLALVFGSEADGLNGDELRHCDAAVHLETPGPYASYNLSHAVAITLYGVQTAAAAVGPSATASATGPAASHPQRERLHGLWVSTLSRAGYFRRTSERRFAPKLRRLIDRLHLSDHDVHTLWGMLAHIAAVLPSGKRSDE